MHDDAIPPRSLGEYLLSRFRISCKYVHFHPQLVLHRMRTHVVPQRGETEEAADSSIAQSMYVDRREEDDLEALSSSRSPKIDHVFHLRRPVDEVFSVCCACSTSFA